MFAPAEAVKVVLQGSGSSGSRAAPAGAAQGQGLGLDAQGLGLSSHVDGSGDGRFGYPDSDNGGRMCEENSSSSSGSDDIDDLSSSLGCARLWWAQCRHGPDMSMSEVTARHAEDDFVHARQVTPHNRSYFLTTQHIPSDVLLVLFTYPRQADARLTPADFHRWLTVARLLAAATGDTEIRVSHWDRMRAIESQRLDRIEKRRGPGGDLSMNALRGTTGAAGELRESPQSITMMTS